MCLAILSTFLPVKIYPLLFLVTILFTVGTELPAWSVWAGLYILYGGFLWLSLHLHPLAGVVTRDQIANFVKLMVNAGFLVAAGAWAASKRCEIQTLLKYLNRTFHLIFLMTLAQLLVYVHAAGWDVVLHHESSALAAQMYDEHLCFWGILNKNVFGARIALFGFLYIVMRYMETRRIPWIRVFLVMSCALLSNSRTPMLALFIGIVYVLYMRSRWFGRIVVLTASALAFQLILADLLRVDKMFDSNDGMGVRLTYWLTFLSRVGHLSVWGNGFMAAEKFLTEFSPFYMGEPHLHNLWFNTYLDFGAAGLLLYTGFLVSFLRYGKRRFAVEPRWYWTAAFLPLLTVMLTLSTGYESDTYVYLWTMLAIGAAAHRHPSPAVARFGSQFWAPIRNSFAVAVRRDQIAQA